MSPCGLYAGLCHAFVDEIVKAPNVDRLGKFGKLVNSEK